MTFLIARSIAVEPCSPTLLNVVALGEIMAPTQYLNVLGIFRRTPLRVRNDVIEMQFGSRSTLCAPTPIALPYF